MKSKSLQLHYQEYTSIHELNEQEQLLLNKAIAQTKNSYSPYSEFKVGAALELENGVFVLGSNQENAAYPSGLCAERTALFTAGANHPEEQVKAIAIAAQSDKYKVNGPVFPCGACRQVMAETEQRGAAPMKVIVGNSTGKVLVFSSIQSLLPFRFDNLDLA